jgi:hypothetical protein
LGFVVIQPTWRDALSVPYCLFRENSWWSQFLLDFEKQAYFSAALGINLQNKKKVSAAFNERQEKL